MSPSKFIVSSSAHFFCKTKEEECFFFSYSRHLTVLLSSFSTHPIPPCVLSNSGNVVNLGDISITFRDLSSVEESLKFNLTQYAVERGLYPVFARSSSSLSVLGFPVASKSFSARVP